MNKSLKRFGYSFIEAIVAIGILSSVIVLSLNVITSNADTENFNRDRLVISSLIQDSKAHTAGFYFNNVRKFGADYKDSCGFMLDTYSQNAANCQSASDVLKLNQGNTFFFDSSNLSNYLLVKNNEEFIIAEQFNPKYRVYEIPVQDFSKYVQFANEPDEQAVPTKFYRLITRDNDGTDNSNNFTISIGWASTNNPTNVVTSKYKIR